MLTLEIKEPGYIVWLFSSEGVHRIENPATFDRIGKKRWIKGYWVKNILIW